MHAGLNADKFATFGCFRKKFYDSFVLQMKKPLNASSLARFRNTRKRMNQGETQCWALFVISKATYTKTAIKTKLVDRFFKNFFITLTDHYTINSPNFVSIENFLSCLTWAQKWVNIEAMSYIWLSICSGTSYCLEFSTTSNPQAARENLSRLVALWNLFPIFFSHSTAIPYSGKIIIIS